MPSSPLKTWEPRKNLLFSISKLNLRNINQWSWRQFLDIECCATNFLFNSFQIQNSLDVVSFQQEKCKSSEFCSFQNCFFSSVYNVQCAENWKLFIVYLCRHNNSVENNSSCYVKYFIVSFLVIKYLTVRLIWEKLISSCKIKKVMEVDEIKKGLASVNNHVENEDDAMIVDLAVQKDDCNYPTVIKGNDCEMKNNVDYVNNLVEDEINENKENKNIVELVANKDLTSMCVNENGTSEKETLGDLIEGSQTETKILINNIKCEPVEESNIVENKAIISTNHENLPKENHVEDGKSLEVKIKEENSVKEKAKENDSSSGHSGSEKKHDPHSRSHHSSSSSSSSRHRSKDDKHRNSSSTHKESSSHRSRDHDKLRRESSSKSRSCHHKPEEKCRCSKSHHSRHHSSSRKSKKSESVKTQCTPEEIAYELRDNNQIDWLNPYFTRVPWVPHPELSKLKYGRYYRIEVDRNGGASTVHLYYDEISHLSEAEMKECALEFIKLSYSEDENECAHYVMGIVHGAAAYLPDLVDYMADHYPTLTVKTGSLASRDNHTTTMSQYRDEVYKTYSNGTFRYAPLDQLSICGVLGEEIGAYFPDFVARLEQSPFMKPVMPWSSLSVVQTDNPRESNDGPIFWVRPGEQMLPANEALKEGARPKKRRNNELDNLAYIAGARSSEARESLFQDRTKAHADQVGVDYGISNTAPTAAVGVLKSVNCGHPEHGNRATKDVIAFHAQDYSELLEILMLDLYEPPQTQCTKWLEVSKLNTLRREGVRYAHIELHDNDVYYLPRKIIHQFQTISSVASVAWHIRLREYFKLHGAPNLHTPTGINKGQVFYEKKNVAVYYPPVCENDLLAAVTSVGSPKTPKKSEKLREYSPFKPSPRKIHKHRSLSIAKKEKLESVPQDKKEDGNEESKLGTPSKKQERSKSDEVKRTTYDESDSSKKELENGFIVKKSENLSHRRSSGDHSSSIKKERKDNQDNHAGHRKMEKSEKSEKSKSDKTPSKPKHESKHNGSSKSKSHEQKSSSSHGKHDSSHKHRDKSESSSKQKDEVNSLKRKNNDMQYYSPHKKVKEESLVESEKPNENGTCGKIVPNHEEDKNRIENSVKKDMNSSFDKCEEDTNCSKVVNNSEDSNVNNESGNSSENIHPVNFVDTQQMDVVDPVNHSIGFDLRQQIYNCGNFISGAAPPPPPPPPPPVSPPPPPPPPESPISSSPNDTLPTVPLADSNRVCSNEIPVPDSPNMEKSPVLLVGNCISESNNSQQIKKMKKKLVKKPVEKGSESYDLLGDIISQMQKKK